MDSRVCEYSILPYNTTIWNHSLAQKTQQVPNIEHPTADSWVSLMRFFRTELPPEQTVNTHQSTSDRLPRLCWNGTPACGALFLSLQTGTSPPQQDSTLLQPHTALELKLHGKAPPSHFLLPFNVVSFFPGMRFLMVKTGHSESSRLRAMNVILDSNVPLLIH
jgi:hypothetical protein